MFASVDTTTPVTAPVTIFTYVAMGAASMRTGYTFNEYDNEQNVIKTASYNGARKTALHIDC